jgi:hypothetical protein
MPRSRVRVPLSPPKSMSYDCWTLTLSDAGHPQGASAGQPQAGGVERRRCIDSESEHPHQHLGVQEAKDSSAIENIVITHDELFKDDALSEDFSNAAAKEILRYRQALQIGFDLVRDSGLLTTTMCYRRNWNETPGVWASSPGRRSRTKINGILTGHIGNRQCRERFSLAVCCLHNNPLRMKREGPPTRSQIATYNKRKLHA